MESHKLSVRFSPVVLITLCMLTLKNIPLTEAKLVDLDIYKDMLVDMHNSFRRKISASNMQEMVWDSKLADKAGYWTKWCSYERHNHKHHSKYGENLFIGEGNDAQRVIFEAIQEWYDEGDRYNYQPFEHRCGDTCEYTQLVWANTNRLGCAINLCGRLFNGYQTLKNVSLLVCFYEPRGNIKGEFPFEAGIMCANCPRGTSCRDSLCADIPYEESNLVPIDIPRIVGYDDDDDGDVYSAELLPRDPDWTENPAYQYAEAPPITHVRSTGHRDRRYPDDLRYRRAHDEERRRREHELRRQHEERERRRQQLYEARRRAQQEPRRQQYDYRRQQSQTDTRRPQYDYRRAPSDYYTDRRYSYRDEYNRVCSCDCRRSTTSPPQTQRTYHNPAPLTGHTASGDMTQTEKYELISVHNLMRDERKLPRIHWNAELEKWCSYIIRCGEQYPGPKHTHTNFGKMTTNEDVYAFVHAWGSESSHVRGKNRHCRGAYNDYNCNRHSILMKPEIRNFACTTTRCRTHRQIVCLYR